MRIPITKRHGDKISGLHAFDFTLDFAPLLRQQYPEFLKGYCSTTLGTH
jgi:hypothetical protein